MATRARGAGRERKVRRRSLYDRQRRRRWLTIVLQIVVVLVLVSGTAYAFYHYVIESPRFQVKRISIEGTDVLSPEAVRAVAGITERHNLLFFDAGEVRERIEAMPCVRGCEIQRAYPDLVIIRIRERVPLATLLLNNHAFELDEEAVVLREIDSLAPHVGPLVTGVTALGLVEPGQRLEHPAVLNALAVWQAFCTQPLSRDLRVSELCSPKANAIAMICDEAPFEIRWGRGDFVRQAKRLNVLWREKGGALPCLEYLDLRFDEDLVCK